MKRVVDIVLALAGLVVSAPFWIVIAWAVKRSSPGPVFHRATRVGLDGRPFTLYKFRSMRAGTQGPGITSATDMRVTHVGRFLRRTKLDELPQLLNVLKGDMSVVGPRPEDPRYVAQYTPEQREVLKVRPGLVSPAVIAYRHEERLLAESPDVEAAYAELFPRKLALDLEYVRNHTLAGDLKILFQAARAVLK